MSYLKMYPVPSSCEQAEAVVKIKAGSKSAAVDLINALNFNFYRSPLLDTFLYINSTLIFAAFIFKLKATLG